MSDKQVKRGIHGASLVLTTIMLLTIPTVNLPKSLADVKLPLLLIPIEELIRIEQERPKPKPIPLSQAGIASASTHAPIFAPTEIQAEPSEILVAEPSLEQPEFGLLSPLYEVPPPENREPTRMEPVSSPLPDMLTMRSNEGPLVPPAAMPAPVSQRGANYRGSGAADLDMATQPSYTGPNLNLPASDIPATGLSHGDAVSTSPTPGAARGDRYQSNAGNSTGPATSAGLSGPGDDVIGEGELSGLLNWLRSQHAEFPPVVQSYMETRSSDLRGITSHSGWDIFVQFSEAEHQLKIFLARGGIGILLADSDFKSRSQLFGMGNVTREGGVISAIAARRDKPTTERTDEFYRVFTEWMSTIGISLGSRAAR
ncbi:hypothetical protein HZB60_10335 [candidate division KSB1 bacterium]|nr:hypothetical protein [candidate division KSB1 bacterium]